MVPFSMINWSPFRLTKTKGEQLGQLAAATFSELSPAEHTLIRTAAAGTLAYCGRQPDAKNPEEENNPVHSAACGEERTIRAALIRWLCISQEAGVTVSIQTPVVTDRRGASCPAGLGRIRAGVPGGHDGPNQG